MNATGAKGGAFGFRISSVNKVREHCICHESSADVLYQLVDTKSAHSTTLLHFLERVVTKHFPEMETFLDELDRPAEAYKGWPLFWC